MRTRDACGLVALLCAWGGLCAWSVSATPKPPATGPGTITGQATDAAGNRYVVTLTPEVPLPTPDPLTISYLAMAPAVVAPGGSAVVTVVLSRAAGTAVVVALKAPDPDAQVAASMTIAAGQDHGTAAVTTKATIATEKLCAIVATYNGQSKSSNLTVRPAIPVPVPVPVPVPTPTPDPALLPLTPRVEGVTQPDGTPLTLPIDAGQPVRFFGSGFGAAAGSLWFSGYPLVVEAWSDTAAVGTVLMAAPGVGFDLRTQAGGSFGTFLPDREAYLEALPPSSRRR